MPPTFTPGPLDSPPPSDVGRTLADLKAETADLRALLDALSAQLAPPAPIPTCPECHVSLEGRDPYKHSLAHWPPLMDSRRDSAEAFARAKSLRGERFQGV